MIQTLHLKKGKSLLIILSVLNFFILDVNGASIKTHSQNTAKYLDFSQ